MQNPIVEDDFKWILQIVTVRVLNSYNAGEIKEDAVNKKYSDCEWVKKYRMVLALLLLAVLLLAGWYLLSSYQKNKVPEDGTLVEKEVAEDERKA